MKYRTLLISLLLVAATSSFGDALALRGYDPPKEAPVFSYTDTGGNRYTNADFIGKVLVVHFWGTWCIPCLRETPSLNRMSQQLLEEGVVVMAIAVNDEVETVRRFIEKNDLHFAVAVDPTDDSMSSWSAVGVPTTLLVDKKGMIRYRVTGLANWEGSQLTTLLVKLARE